MMTSANLDSEDIPQHDFNTYLQNCASQFKKLHKFKANSTIEIRIYQGGKGFGNQLLPFRQACDIIYSMSTFRYVFLTCADVNTFKFTELDIINWLLEGDIHFIISHIHQGIISINMNKLYTEITRLHDHPGFPNGSNLLCPVFTQDKYKYLQALMPKGMCNPTLKVDFLPVMDYESIKEDVQA